MKRRTPRTWAGWLTAAVYPKGGWGRAFRYTRHRLSRLPDAPHRIARGIFAGVFISFTPLFGLHVLVAALMAWAMRGNVVAALIATLVGNPLTFPVIAVLSIRLGNWMLGNDVTMAVPASQIFAAFGSAGAEIWQNLLAAFSPDKTDWPSLHRFFHGLLLPYLVGGIGPGILAALLAYWVSLPVLTAYQGLRDKRRAARAARRAAAAAAMQPGGDDAGDGRD